MRPTAEQHRKALAEQARWIERYRAGEVSAEQWPPIRLGYGLYYQLDHTSHMQRIKIPGGILHSAQLERIAEVAERYGRGMAHVTTRQDLQLHWIPLEGAADIYARLLDVGITTRGACADSVRNVTACPYAGVKADEVFDVAPYCLAVHEYFLFNPLNLTLPRKFKIGIEGCPEDCAQAIVNDIALYARLGPNGQRGFALYAGGGLGAQPFLAQPVSEFVGARDILIVCEAIVRVQHRYGERKNRRRARMKYLCQRMGWERFVAAVEEARAQVERERGEELRAQVDEVVAEYRQPEPRHPGGGNVGSPGAETARWLRTNTRRQRQPGYRAALVTVPLGDLDVVQMRTVARLAAQWGNGTLRTTNDQNLVLPWIPEGALCEVHRELVAVGLGSPEAGHLTDVVSCPGMDYCSLAITRSMGMAERLREHLARDHATRDGFVEGLGPFTVKISGCPNACGQHHIGDIGLTGQLLKTAEGGEQPSYSILVGGCPGEGRARIGRRLGRFPEEVAPRVIAAVARFFAAERKPGEPFSAFVERVGIAALTRVADSAAASGADT